MIVDAIEFTKKLISFPSITPLDAGAINFLKEILDKYNFDCHCLDFCSGSVTVKNLYARLGNKSPNLCFAGHTDVVPPGDIKQWASDPFKPEIRNSNLYGRGAVDMKTTICAFIVAVLELLGEKHEIDGSVSLIITGDEEGEFSDYGTKSVLKWMKQNQQEIDYCIVGEPTSKEILGDTIKIGSRGSANFNLKCYGTQGHVAYSQFADNPISRMMLMLQKIKDSVPDRGSEYFDPSNCEITTIDVGNTTSNLIPDVITARFNVRYNNHYTPDTLFTLIDNICSEVTKKYELSMDKGREVFLVTPNQYTDIMVKSIKKITGVNAKFSTSGGTSDAAFIKDMYPAIEFGLLNKTAHKIDENVATDDIYKITQIYKEFIKNFFDLKKTIK